MFEGPATRWLEFVHRRVPNVTWDEFCRLLQSRFGRNLHQSILRKFFSIQQTSTVEDYVDRFSELFDQLAAYEQSPNTVNYVTHFMEGLKPAVRLAVGIQQPTNLDTAYQLALLHEELGAGTASSNSSGANSRHSTALPLPLPPVQTSVNIPVTRTPDDRKLVDSSKHSGSKDKWGALRAYRKARGLCFICGERWGKDHVCKQEVQLHVVQEMVEFLQQIELSNTDDSTSQHSVHMITLSAAALGEDRGSAVKTMQLRLQMQGLNMLFLVDSGSSHSFVNATVADKLQGLTPMSQVLVKVANGDTVPCDKQLLNCNWSCAGHKFMHSFKVFPLGSYDGILGFDWLSSHSPMLIDWRNHWMSFTYQGSEITLLGIAAVTPVIAVLEVCALLTTENSPILPEVQF